MKKISSFFLLFFFVPLCCFASTLQPIAVSYKDAPLRDVITFVSELTGSSFVFEHQDLRINWIQNNLYKENIVTVFSSVLDTYQFSLKRISKDFYQISHKDIIGFSPEAEQTSVLFLDNVAGEEVAGALTSIYGNSLKFSFIESGNILIASGLYRVLVGLESLVHSIDTPKGVDFDEIHLAHIPVRQALDAIKKLELIKDGLVYPDYWRDVVVFRGSAHERLLVRSALQSLDVPSAEKISRSFSVNTISAEVASSLLSGSDEDLQVQTLTPEKIFITGSVESVRHAAQLLKRVDGTGLQVRVHAVVASLNDSAFYDFGLNLSGSSNNSNFSLGSSTFKTSLSLTPSFLLDFVNSISANIHTVEGVSSGEVLSSPILTVLNGHAASMHVGQNVPFITQTQESDSGNTIQSIERHDVGLKLEIIPVIEDNFVRLNIKQEVSSIDPDTTSASDIVTDKKQIESTVLVADGETIFLGGVKSSELGKQLQKVPFLGSVPLLGTLFQYKQDTKLTRNLVISLRPEIIGKAI